MVSGTNIVSQIDSYAVGKAVQVTTKMKISQTWLASHTGPIERSMSPRGAAPRSGPPAARSHRPAPKSAPPKHGVGREGQQQHDGDHGAHGTGSTASGRLSAVGP